MLTVYYQSDTLLKYYVIPEKSTDFLYSEQQAIFERRIEERMKKRVCCFMFLLVMIVCVAFSGVSHGIELNPIKERIEETIKLGESNPGKKIFETDLVKSAIFGNWPNYGGGLIKTKLVDLAVMTAMMRKARKSPVQATPAINARPTLYPGGGRRTSCCRPRRSRCLLRQPHTQAF